MQEILYKFQDQEQGQIQHKEIMGIVLHQHHYNEIITGNNINQNQGSVQQQPGNIQNNSNNTTIPQRQQPNNNSGGSVITR